MRRAASSRPAIASAAGGDVGPEDRDQSARVRADLLGGERGVAALPRHVRVGDQPAQVRVPGRVPREQDDARVRRRTSGSRQRQRSGLANGERRAEDRADALALARVDEPGGAVEPVAVGERDRRHLQLGRPARAPPARTRPPSARSTSGRRGGRTCRGRASSERPLVHSRLVPEPFHVPAVLAAVEVPRSHTAPPRASTRQYSRSRPSDHQRPSIRHLPITSMTS